jgi:hypothetical protein
MEQINNLIILITPFHKMVVNKLFPELLDRKDTLVLYSEFVNHKDIAAPKIKLINYNFSRSELFSAPIKNFPKTRAKLNSAKNKVNSLISEFDFSLSLKIIICSDKDIFTQIFLNKLFDNDNQRKLIAIEEGLGFYVKTNKKDQLFSLIYRMVTPVLFGTRLYYVKRLGIYPKISTIYIRALDLLPKGVTEKTEYKTFKLNSSTERKEIVNGKCLFFSFPEQDYDMDVELKINLIEDIANFALKNNKELIIKPHPREKIELIQERLSNIENIKIIDKKTSGESLNYFDYEYIVNFFSSIILDIIENDYPENRLITIGIPEKPLITFKNNLRYCSLANFKAADVIKFNY